MLLEENSGIAVSSAPRITAGYQVYSLLLNYLPKSKCKHSHDVNMLVFLGALQTPNSGVTCRNFT